MKENQNSNETEQQVAEPINPEVVAADQRDDKKRAFPTWIDILAIIGIFAVGQIVARLVVTLMGCEIISSQTIAEATTALKRTMEFEMGRTSLYYALLSQPLVLLLVIIYRKIRGGSASIARSARGFNPTILLWGFIMLIAVAVVIEPLMQFLPEINAPAGRGIFMLIALIIVAPIFEELLCRGVILESVRKKHGGWIACVVSSLVFGVMHLEPQSILNAFAIGLLLGYLYIRTNSIFAPIIIHAFNNIIAYLFLVFGLSGITLHMLIGNETIYRVVYGICFGIVILSIFSISQQVRYLDKKKLGQNGKENNKI